MLRIGQVEATATQDGKYTDGSVAGGIAATRLRAAAFNAMQEELAHIVESAELALDINDMTQVLKAIQKLTLSRANPFADIKSDGAAAISTALTNLGLVNNGVVGRLIGRPRIITSSETYIPTSGAKFAWVQIVGGGGGGGGATSSQNFNAAGGGGGAGGYAAKWVDLSSISSVVVTIGAGGNGASASGTNGSSGGITSFGSIFSASGGSLGNSAVGTGNNTSTIVGAGNQGGTGTGGDLNCSGGSGLGGVSASPTIAGASVGPGIGGSSILSGPGGYGAGGNGGATVANSVPGSSGRSGIAIIWEYA